MGWRMRSWRVRTKERLLMAIWERLSTDTKDKLALWWMGRLSSTDEVLQVTEVGGITVDQFIAATKRRDAK